MAEQSPAAGFRRFVWTSVALVAPFGLAAVLLQFRFGSLFLTNTPLVLAAVIVAILSRRGKEHDLSTGHLIDIFGGGLAVGALLGNLGLLLVVQHGDLLRFTVLWTLASVWCGWDLHRAMRDRDLGISDED